MIKKGAIFMIVAADDRPLPPKPILKNGFKGPSVNEERRIGRQYYENCVILS